MSGQQSQQRVRKAASPGAGPKQGPMRAIVPLSMMQTCSPTRCLKSSPSNSPPVTWPGDCSKMKTRLSPDNRVSPESTPPPSSKGEKGAKGGGGVSSLIRRTASVDTIYLLGQWQRDALYLSYCGRLMVDRATQTPDEFEEPDRRPSQKKSSASSSESLEMKLIRQRLVRGGRSYQSRQSPPVVQAAAASGQGEQVPSISPHIPIPPKAPPIPRMRSSVEGLNQEIERIVLREISNPEGEEVERLLGPTPEGHRAPIADMFRNNNSSSNSQQSVDTQTPFDRTDSSNSSSDSHSISPLVMGNMDLSRPSSSGSKGSGCSPDLEGGSHKLATSPHINKFLAREPPDGCEKVTIAEETRSSVAPEFNCPKPSMNFVLLPSQRSAFDPLCKNCGALSNGDILKPPPSSKRL